MNQHKVWHRDSGVKSAQDYITLQELASSSRLLTADSEGMTAAPPAQRNALYKHRLYSVPGERMSEQSKEGKKEALFGEQMGYLRSGAQASVMPKAIGTWEDLEQ